MSTQQLTAEAMALPLPERVALAQELWRSIEDGAVDADEQAVLQEAARRDEELSSGAVGGRSHEDVLAAAMRAIRCH